MFVVVVIILLFLLVFSSLLANFKLGRVIIFIVTLLLLYAVFLFIKYTPDKEYYTWWINFPEFSIDKEPTFQLVAAYIRAHKYGYQFLHVSFLSVYSFLFLLLISRFTKNVYVITLLYIPLIFIFYGTQLRYFLGYFAAILGFYYLFVSKRNILAILFFVFAVLSHYSLILFVPFFFLYKIKTKFFVRISYLSLAVFVGYTVLTTIIFNLFSGLRFLFYLKGDLVSSYAGGIFAFGTLLPIYILVHQYYNYRLKINPKLASDDRFNFLYKMSIIPMIYIGIAITVQVIGHRFIMTGMLFPILLFFYKFNEVKDLKKKLQFYSLFFILYILVFIHFNFSVGLVLGEWEMVQEMNKMLKSNEMIKYLIY
ncbi:EpsG family protein [Kaistella flava (ex Peng et al. 2021)]|uniref:EpsG family protein n=1 Tax=Kaistella flava (ex Peng et al. 2021) TaxID=2038776 RepID=A0A7M2YAA1_9FLAO|nr:EpsG family protein [Kaistella flava (ex Peng et al. 2021)]QOW10565.1 EpsG family protein [Kaistella flava (ex Peng et al. 2021)]